VKDAREPVHTKHIVPNLRGYYPPKFALFDSENPLEYGSRRWGGDNGIGWAFDPVWDKPFTQEKEATQDESPLKSFYTTDICYSGMCRAFRQTRFSGSTPEEIRTIGPDASIFYWQMYLRWPHIDLKWLDIHTIPQHSRSWHVWRRASDVCSLTIRDCKIRRIQFDAVAKYKSIAIIDCPLFEGFDDLPTSCSIRIQVENCPLFYHSPVAFVPADSSPYTSANVNHLFVHRFPHGDAYHGRVFTTVRTFTLPNLGKMVDFWARAREELAAEAFKPARLNRRIEEFGLEAALEC
jgi:hypothetical protein